MRITDCFITGNSAGSSGGGVHAAGDAVALRYCTIVDNKATQRGGGVTVGMVTTMTLENCIIVGNQGGGVRDDAKARRVAHNLLAENTPRPYDGPSTRTFATARQLNEGLAGARGNIGGDALFAIKSEARKGQWTAAPQYRSETGTTLLEDRRANFSGLAGKVMLLRPDKARRTVALIVAVRGATQLEVLGDFSKGTARGRQYRLLDYRLQNGSSALNAGEAVPGITEDYDGGARDGKAPDLGAAEAPADYVPAPDHTPPVTTLGPLAGVQPRAAIEIPFTFTSEQNGLRQVQLYYRKDGGPWTAGEAVTTTGQPLRLDLAALGDGRYGLTTVATDTAGNSEAAPGTPKAEVLVVTKAPQGRLHVAAKARGNGLGEDWANAMGSINEALRAAAGLGAGEVWVEAGTYREAVVMPGGVALYGGFAGRETALAQRALAGNATIIDVKGLAAADKIGGHAVLIWGVRNCRLDGFTITGGHHVPELRQKESSGAGIKCLSAGPGVVIDHCLIEKNESDDEYGSGGGIECVRSDVRVAQCRIQNNQAWRGGGIGIDNGAAEITNCLIANNTAKYCGGGIYRNNNNNNTMTQFSLVNCTLTGNHVLAPLNNFFMGGGGLYLSDSIDSRTPPGDPPLIANCIFARNEKIAIRREMGRNEPPPRIRNCLFFENTNGVLFYYLPNDYVSLGGGIEINKKIPGAVGNLDGDPKFVDAAAGDFHLKPDSPAIDAGGDASGNGMGVVNDDLDGKARPQRGRPAGAEKAGEKVGDGSGYDIGAYEAPAGR